MSALDPNPEITALREFVKAIKPLEGMFRLYIRGGNHFEYATAMLTALETAEESLKTIDRVVAKFGVTQ